MLIHDHDLWDILTRYPLTGIYRCKRFEFMRLKNYRWRSYA